MPLATEEQIQDAQNNTIKNAISPQQDKRRVKRILLAEDNHLNQEIITRLLHKKNYEVQRTSDGTKVLSAFSNSEVGYFDAIIMEIRMPVMDGLTATRAIRALDREDAKKIPIIAMSANAYDEDIKKSLDAGMNEHLSKPIETQKLYETLEKLIEKYDAANEK